jgi:hypothetical protein
MLRTNPNLREGQSYMTVLIRTGGAMSSTMWNWVLVNSILCLDWDVKSTLAPLPLALPTPRSARYRGGRPPSTPGGMGGPGGGLIKVRRSLNVKEVYIKPNIS